MHAKMLVIKNFIQSFGSFIYFFIHEYKAELEIHYCF